MNFGVTADLIDENERGILFVKRKNGPYKNHWALPGGFLNPGKENLRQAGVRELYEETGLIAHEEDLVLIGEYSSPERDPRGHIISHAYYITKSTGEELAGDDAARVKRFPRDNLPKLAFDHEKILQDYFEFRRNGGYGDSLGRVGVIGRFKPLHNGAAVLLEILCEKAQHVTIGIGSSNKYNERNPFTARETEAMINAFLSPRFANYKVIKIPDFAQIPGCEDGQRWRKFVLEKFGKLDHFVSGNDFVRSLLENDYAIIHPGDVVPRDRHVFLRAGRVRYEIATYQNWQELVQKPVADYIESKKLDDRLREEFGLQIIASVNQGNDFNKNESAKQEKLHAREV